MKDKSRDHIGWIDLAKGICILLVVFHHSIQSVYLLPDMPLSGITATAAKLYELLSIKLVPIRMPLFFMISGFLVYRGVTRYQWDQVGFKRIQTIWYVYLLWSIIQWLAIGLIVYSSGAAVPGHSAMLSAFATNITDFTVLTLTGSSSLWYLYALPAYFIICKLLSSKPWLALSFFLICYGLSSYYQLQFPTSSIVKNGIYYAIGVFFCPVLFPLINHISHKAFLFIAGLLGIKIGLGLLEVDIHLINTLLFVSIMVFFINWLQDVVDIPIMRWIGKNTLAIYIIHYILLKMLAFIIVPWLIAQGFFAQQAFVTVWYLTAPVLAVAFMTGGSLLIWHCTNVGVGRYLYASPRHLTAPLRAAWQSR